VLDAHRGHNLDNECGLIAVGDDPHPVAAKLRLNVLDKIEAIDIDESSARLRT
jgi:hypothetical protein